MAATIPRITVTDEWQSVSALTGLAAGSAIKIQHTGGQFVDIVLSATIPTDETQLSGEQLRTNEWYAIEAGEPEAWVKVVIQSARLSIQANA